jgi:alkylation response protein AidB-like acyl-CoA dehydrogenase
MELVFSQEQEELRRSVRRFIEAKSPLSAVREQMESEIGYDADLWHQLADQLGVQSIAIPEEYGGAGFSFVDLAIVLEELGRGLVPSPFFASVVLAAYALLDAGDDAACRAYLPGIADGSRLATLAFTEDSGAWDLGSIAMSAVPDGAGWSLTGTKAYVVDGHVADLILVAARTPAGLSLFAVEAGAPGLTRVAVPTLDQTRRLARLVFEGTPARLVGTDGRAQATLARTLDRAAIALAAEQLGGAQAVLDMAVDYAKVRHQFDRPIGSFQAIKHKASEMLLRVESARSATYYGMWAVADEGEDVPIVASLVKAYCSEAYFHAAGENIQIHGGIGFTWEHDAHLYFKRAKSTQLFLGDGDYHRENLAERVGI